MIELNNTHIILFNSPPDSQQIEFFAKELKKVNFFKECYTKLIAEPHGHILIVLDSKTSECLRFCSNIVGPGPTKFHLPSSPANNT